MKICVIGNSHAGMLVNALSEAPQDDLTCDFFAIPGNGPSVFNIDGAGVLSTDAPAMVKQFVIYRMSPSVNLATCDAIVIVAMTKNIFQIKPLLGDHVIFGWPGTDATRRIANPPLLSEPALCNALVSQIQTGLAHRYVKAIRAVLPQPILLVREPAPSEKVLETPAQHPFLKRVAASGDLLSCHAVLSRAHHLAFRRVPDLTLLDQPAGTLTSQGLTQRSYNAGARRLNPRYAQPDLDVLHANATYGRLVWDQIRAAAGS